MRPGDRLTVQCLATFRGEVLDTEATGYEKRRDLPDMDHRARRRVSRAADRTMVHVRRAWRRHRLATSGGYDLVHIETLVPLDALTLPLLARRVTVVAVVHDVEPHERRLPPRLQRAILRRIYAAPDRLVVLHPSVGERLATTFGIDPARIAAIPHPLPGPFTPNEPADRSPIRVLAFGSLRANKGTDVLLAALDRLPPGLVELTVAGQGDPAIARAVEQAAARRTDVVARLGYADPATKEALYQDADVVVLPYLPAFGSQSGVLFDAYRYGVPSIVSDVGAIGPTVRDDGSGWVVPAGDVAALARALETAATDTEARRAAAARTRAAAVRSEEEAVGAALRTVYADTVAAGGGGGGRQRLA